MSEYLNNEAVFPQYGSLPGEFGPRTGSEPGGIGAPGTYGFIPITYYFGKSKRKRKRKNKSKNKSKNRSKNRLRRKRTHTSIFNHFT